MEVRSTSAFDEWLKGLRDFTAKARVLTRIDRLSIGNAGDCRSVGEGVMEMRIHYGPGYRVYFVRQGETVVVLLAGGDKDSQARDIKKAIDLAKEL
ncbi:MAG: addiction module antitoxin RelB [Alphaproteobacteria bacterium RIFCSPHIGHO2_12_FULL_63_12]|nr:MAG: addiction module antitoxin RelB [Alphaproteobacteria bacterium RIFCSPHIGHO2_12_FULL_63_12]